MEKLQKIIATSGYCSRRKAEELILAGKVKVNGEIVRELGTKASYEDVIFVEGKSISKKEDKVYYLFNKPRGVVTTSHDNLGRKTVLDFLPEDERIYPVGRLDYDTTGVLLVTNDGELTNLLTHPKNHVEKTYIVKVEGILLKQDLEKLCKGVVIDGKKTSRAKAKIKKIDKKTNTTLLELKIYEGRNHQVKKMLEAIGYPVKKLKREKFSFLTTQGLLSGEYRTLSIKEVKKLYQEAKQESSNH